MVKVIRHRMKQNCPLSELMFETLNLISMLVAAVLGQHWHRLNPTLAKLKDADMEALFNLLDGRSKEWTRGLRLTLGKEIYNPSGHCAEANSVQSYLKSCRI
jgi:hypothetical protein